MLHPRSRFAPAVAALTALVVGLVCAPLASAATVVVDSIDGSDGGWTGTVSQAGTGLGTAVDLGDGPDTPTSGTGSANLRIGSDGNDAAQFRTAAFNGRSLADLGAFTYSTYVTTPGGQVPYLILNVDYDANGSLDDQWFYEPVYQDGNYGWTGLPGSALPQAFALNTWQTWNARDGGWWSLDDLTFGPPLKSLDTLIADHPGVQLATTTAGALRVVTGFGAGSWDNHNGYADSVRLAWTAGPASDDTYDFERSTEGSVIEVAGTEGTVSTPGSLDPADNPVTTDVKTGDTGGTVTINEVSDPGEKDFPNALTAGYELFGQEVQITAPAGTAANPLEIGFWLSNPDIATDKIEVFRNGVLVEDCLDPALPLTTEDPCVFSILETGAGDVRIDVYTTAASGWGFGAETDPPETSITTDPGAATTDTTPSFSYHSDEDPSTFTCELDAVPVACGNDDGDDGSVTLGPLADGNYTFTVYATDSALNDDPTPSSFNFWVDTVIPTVTITSGPSGTINSSNDPAFAWTDGDTGSGIVSRTCTLSHQITFAIIETGPCTSPKQYTDLPDGPYRFDITVTDAAGNAATDTRNFRIDLALPQVEITTAVPDSNSTSASVGVRFSDPQANPHGSSGLAAVECRIYRTDPVEPVPGFTACNSPGPFTSDITLPAAGGTEFNRTASYGGLLSGTYKFEIRITDGAGNQATAFDSWSVDAVAPDTVIDSGPGQPYDQFEDAEFVFHGTDPSPSSGGYTFECKLDGGSYAPCTSPKDYFNLADGAHSFYVKARDHAGNWDPTPAEWHWTIDTEDPVVTIHYPKDGGYYSRHKDVDSHYECYDPPGGSGLEDPPEDCEGIVVGHGSHPTGTPIYNDADGTYQFQVTSKDLAGNTTTVTHTYYIRDFHGIVTRHHNPPSSPLIAYWRMDDPIGSELMLDSGSYDHDGTYKNDQDSGPIGISGDGNRARSFFGDAGYSYVNGIHAPSRYTISMFVRFNDTGNQAFFEHGGAGQLWLEDKKFHFRAVSNFRDYDIVATPPSQVEVFADTWYHVVGWLGIDPISGKRLARLYVNGAMMGEKSIPKWTSGASTLYVGYANGLGFPRPWMRGSIDEVAYFGFDLDFWHIWEIWLADPPPALEGDAPPDAPTSNTDGNSNSNSNGYGDDSPQGGSDTDGAGQEPVEEDSIETTAEPAGPEGTWVRSADKSTIEIVKKGKGWIGKIVAAAARKAKSAKKSAKKRCGLRKGVKAIAFSERKRGGYAGAILEAKRRDGKCRSRKVPFKAKLSEDGNTLTLKKNGKKGSTETLTRAAG